MLKDRESFAILLANTETELIVVAQNISLKKHIKYNRAKLKDDVEYSYVLYTEPQGKQYIFDMARNKKLKLVWKDDEDFYIIDFSNNTKGDIVCNLTTDVTDKGIIEGSVITPKLKSDNYKKVMLLSSQQLERDNPYSYEEFKFYIKKQFNKLGCSN